MVDGVGEEGGGDSSQPEESPPPSWKTEDLAPQATGERAEPASTKSDDAGEDSGSLFGGGETSAPPKTGAGDDALLSALADPTRRIGPYEVLSVLGEGGMGVVLKAMDPKLRRVVAIKQIRGIATDRALKRFEREAQLLARLDHPGISRVHQVVVEGEGSPYLVMDLVEGIRLQSLCGEPEMTPRRVAEIGLGIAEAVAHAHERGVVHRDLKPGNVMLTEDGRPIVLDFGLARSLDDESVSLTQSQGGALGTPGYMPPEQIDRPKYAGPLADVYGLGGLLYAMLTGRPPFQGGSHLDLYTRIRLEDPVPPSQLRQGVSRDLEAVCLKCLEKHPDHRYESAAAVAAELQRVLLAEAIEAKPVPALKKMVRRLGRGPDPRRSGLRLLRAALTLVVLLILAGLPLNAWRDAQRRGELERDVRDRAHVETARAWVKVRREESQKIITEGIDRVERLAERAGWARTNDRGNLLLAAAWDALRRGNPELARTRVLIVLQPEDRERMREITSQIQQPTAVLLRSIANWRAWVEKRDGEVSRIVALLAESVLLVEGIRALPPLQLEKQTPELRAELKRHAARAVLADVRSGISSDMLGHPPRMGVVEERVDGEWARFLRGVDPRSGEELWRRRRVRKNSGRKVKLLTSILAARSARCWTEAGVWVAPLLIKDRQTDVIVVGIGTEIVALDAWTGVVRRRLRMHDFPASMIPSGSTRGFVVVQACGTQGDGTGESVFLLAKPSKWSSAPSGGDPGAFDWMLRDRVVLPDDAAGIAAVRSQDPTHPLWDYLEGIRALENDRAAEGRAKVERVLGADLSAFELAYLADELERRHGQRELSERFVERAIAVRRSSPDNPALSILPWGNPASPVRKMTRRALLAGEQARAVRLMAQSRELSPVIEGDAEALPIERAWLEEHGFVEEARALEPTAAVAERIGRVYLVPEAWLTAFDFACLAALVLPVVLSGVVLIVWTRTRSARVAALRHLGYRTSIQRLAAFMTNPVQRGSRTCLAYASRRERALLFVGSIAFVASFLYVAAVTAWIGHLIYVPGPLLSGQAAHPSALSWISGAAKRVEPEDRAPHKRFLVEATLSLGGRRSAKPLLDTLLELDPDDAFAQANLAFLKKEGPRELVSTEDLRALLEVSDSPAGLVAWHLGRIQREDAELSHGHAFDFLKGIHRPQLFDRARFSTAWAACELGEMALLPMLLLLLVSLAHLPFPRRESTAPSEAASGRLERFGRMVNLFVPGALLLARGRVIPGALACLLAPALWGIGAVGVCGALIPAGVLPPQLHNPFVERADVLVTGLSTAVGATAWVALGALYLAAWIHHVRLVRAR